MNLLNRICSLVLLTASVLILTHCTPTTQQVRNQSLENPYPLAANDYLQQADDSEGEQRQAMLVKAAGRLISDGNWRRGKQLLNQVKPAVATKQTMQEKRLLLAQIDLMRNQTAKAINQLAAIDNEAFSLPDQIRYHRLLANAYERRHSLANGVEERIKLEEILPNEQLKQQNRRKIWLSLTKLPPASLTTLALEAPQDSQLKAWMELAAIPRRYANDPQKMVAAVNRWQGQYSQHPGSRILPQNIKAVEHELTTAPKKIAVLLPLTGSVSGPGNAVRDGIMAGFFGKKPALTSIKFYDTNKGDAGQLYQQALAKGADYVVGPLLKSNVEQVAQQNITVPTVVLNDIPGVRKANLYQFGLSPNEEAHQVALKARSTGLTRALVIAPAGAWGDGIINSFTNTWQQQGGTVVDTLRFSKTDDINQAVKSFLHITQSEQREKKIKQLLGSRVKTLPRRRQDFDMIFLQAYPSQARQIQPMLKYYFAGNIPVYATSSVYAANANSRGNRDLDGIIFCDMPWVFKHQPLKNTAWPEQFNSYDRLYALGLDSYALSTQLNQLLLFPAMGVDDNTGILYLQPNHRLNRLLEWAQFKQGQVKHLQS